MKAMTAVVIGILVVSVAHAQTPRTAEGLAARYTAPDGMTLAEAMAHARQQEPGLRAARSGPDVAAGLQTQAGLRPNPVVTVERRAARGGRERETMASVSWPLDLFRRRGRLAVATGELEAARHALSNRERLVAGEVRAHYGDVLAALAELTVLDGLAAAVERQHALLRSRVQEGASPPLDRDLLDVEVRRLQADRLLQAGRVEAAMIELKRILGLSPADPLRVRDSLEQIVRGESASLPAADPRPARADVREAEARVQVADARIDRARREGALDLSLFGSYIRMDGGSAMGPRSDLAGGAMVMVPLFNRNQGETAAARAGRTRAVAEGEAVRLAAVAQVAAARAQDEHARQALAIFGDGAVRLARQNLEVVAQSYELGRRTVFDVLAEQRRYLEIERAHVEALRAAFEARTALELAMGDGR